MLLSGFEPRPLRLPVGTFTIWTSGTLRLVLPLQHSRMASGQYVENIEKRKRVTNEFWLASLAV